MFAALVEGEADVLEIGVAFSDPIAGADGPAAARQLCAEIKRGLKR